MTRNLKSLHPISKYLMDFLDTNITHKLGCFQKTKFSSDTVNMFYFLYEKMILANQEFAAIKIDTTPLHSFAKGNDHDIIEERIKAHIKNANLSGYRYSFTIKNRSVEVNIHCESNCDKTYFDRAIKKIYIWLVVAFSFSEKTCSQTLSIYLYLTDLEKIVPGRNIVIDTINANTGFTFTCKSKNEINIYRKEEWFKVFIHETFHNLGLDFSNYENSHIDKKILSIFPVKADVCLFETYCEMWAEILNVLFIVFNQSKNSETIENMISKVEKLLDYERMFSIFQCAKVLKHMGVSYTQLFERSHQSHMIRNLRYKEKTCVLSYFIIKSIFMYKINFFFKWCILHNGNSLKFGHVIDVNKSMEDYCDLVEKHHQDKKYIACVTALEYWFSKQERTQRKDDTEFKTLRMSLFEEI
jgi:hypothetical protein